MVYIFSHILEINLKNQYSLLINSALCDSRVSHAPEGEVFYFNDRVDRVLSQKPWWGFRVDRVLSQKPGWGFVLIVFALKNPGGGSC